MFSDDQERMVSSSQLDFCTSRADPRTQHGRSQNSHTPGLPSMTSSVISTIPDCVQSLPVASCQTHEFIKYESNTQCIQGNSVL